MTDGHTHVLEPSPARTYEIVKAYNSRRLGTYSYTAAYFEREPKMRRGHLTKFSAREWCAYVEWCAGFERLMGF